MKSIQLKGGVQQHGYVHRLPCVNMHGWSIKLSLQMTQGSL